MNKNYLSICISLVVASEVLIADEGKKETIMPQADITAPVFSKAKYKYVKKPITADDGKIHGYVRMHHIFDGEDNGFDKVTGSTLGLGLGYGKEVTAGLKIGAEFYGVMDSGLTDTDETTIAYGQFMNEEKSPNELDAGYAVGAHISYEKKGLFKAKIARSQFKSPLTKIQITHVPNLYEYARVDGKVLGGNASLSYMTKMAYGSRSAADWGLIGEFTGTAGMQQIPFDVGGGKPYLQRGKFHGIDETVTGSDSNGILVLGYEKKSKKFDYRVWDFKIDDVANNFYADANYKMKIKQGIGFKISGQLWNQNIDNPAYEENYGGTLLGAEAVLKSKKLIGKLAYTTKDDGGILNAWGANPGYTSSIFSRNEYRSNVDAYKATIIYKPMKKFKIMLSYADYGKSDMFNKKYKTAPMTDATERDIALIYKPRKDTTIKLFNADRTSEYSTSKKERTQNHTRLIVNFRF